MNILNLFKKTPGPIFVAEPEKLTFVDEEKPYNNDVLTGPQVETIANYLNADFKTKGMNDGFEYHSTQVLDKAKQMIKAEFRYLLDKSLETLMQRVLDLKMTFAEVKDLSPDLKEKIEIAIIANEKSVEDLNYQKELSSMDEGWVMKLIYNYEIGFINGTNTYIEGESFLKSVNNF